MENNGEGSIRVLDDAVVEVAKIGAQDVNGVRVATARVEERAAVRLVVDVEYGKPVSELIGEVQTKAKDNIAEHLPDRKFGGCAGACRASRVVLG